MKVGSKVKIVSSENGSINKVDDIRNIVENDLDENDGLDYRVFVAGRTDGCGTENTANWHNETELEIIEE
jgi:hypothetical protein